MERFNLRALILGLIVGALILGAYPPVSIADEEPPAKGEDTEGAEEEPKTISWVKGWAAGQAKAKEDGKLIFLYFGRYTPT